jgi:hypothetical protein
MRKVLFLMIVLLSATIASAQIYHSLYGVPLGSKDTKAFAEWNAREVAYEQSQSHKDSYIIKTKPDEEARTNPTTIEVMFINHRLFSVRYTYPRDHYSTICDLIKFTYGPYLRTEDQGFRMYYDETSEHFITLGHDDDNTYLSYGMNFYNAKHSKNRPKFKHKFEKQYEADEK